MDPDFWEKMRLPFTKELAELAQNSEDVLRKGFKCNEFEIGEFMKTLEKTLNTFTTEYILRLFRDINTNLLRKFNLLFKKDENGKNREWRDIEEGKIRDIWSKCRAQMAEIIEDFKYIKLPKTVLTESQHDNSSKNISLLIPCSDHSWWRIQFQIYTWKVNVYSLRKTFDRRES